MKQKQYDIETAEREFIKLKLKKGIIMPDEAIDYMVIHLRYSFNRAVELVDDWGSGKFLPYAVLE